VGAQSPRFFLGCPRHPFFRKGKGHGCHPRTVFFFIIIICRYIYIFFWVIIKKNIYSLSHKYFIRLTLLS
jgi:hypothetical protein